MGGGLIGTSLLFQVRSVPMLQLATLYTNFFIIHVYELCQKF